MLQLPPCGVTFKSCVCKEGLSIVHIIRVLNVDDFLVKVKLSHFAFRVMLLDLWFFTNQIEFNLSEIACVSRWFCALYGFQAQILGLRLVGDG